MLIRTAATLVVTLCFAKDHHHHDHKRHHDAHEHGAAMLDIAIEAKTVEMELHAPAESIYGFEHTAKTDAEKKAQADAYTAWKTRAAEMIGLPATCTSKSSEIETEAKGKGHAEVDADANFECSVALDNLTIDPSKLFPGIKRLKVQIAGQKQKGATITSFPHKIDLK